MEKNFIKINHTKLYNLIVKIFIKFGCNLKNAKKVSFYLTQADLSGQNSHGVARAPLYLEKIKDKKLIPNAKVKIFNQKDNIAQNVDKSFVELGINPQDTLQITKNIIEN